MSTTVSRGYKFGLRFTIWRATGAKESLAGASINWSLGASPSSETLIARDEEEMTISTEEGTAVFTLTPSETGGLAPGRYYHQLSVAPAGDLPDIYFSGWLTVVPRL